jgi:hypothetical protein
MFARLGPPELSRRGSSTTSIHSIAEKKSSRKPISKILHSPGPIVPGSPGLLPYRYRVLPQNVVVLDGYAGLWVP